jgi:NAD(P)-dependent dehydrogenase (short-subunit alcohol dehydrogenase family)
MKNRSVLITGASTGMGEATARLLAQRGYTVFAGVRSPQAVERLRDGQVANLHPLQLDVTREQDIAQAYHTVRAKAGTVALVAVINNAGNAYTTPTEHYDPEKARELMDTHFWGTVRVTRTFLPLLREYAREHPGQARILNVGSIGSLSAFPFIQFYNAAKFAILGFTESIRFELAPFGIQAIAILPGSVQTQIWHRNARTLQETLAALGEEGRALYQPYLARYEALAGSLEKSGISSQQAAKTFLHALEVPNPRLKYFIGTDAKAVQLMVKYLPDGIRHWLIRRQLGF